MPNGLPLLFPGRRLAALTVAQQEGPEAVEAEKAIRLLSNQAATPAEVLPFVEPSRVPAVISETERRLALPTNIESPIGDLLNVVAIGLAGAAVVGGVGAALLPSLGFLTPSLGAGLASSFAGGGTMGHVNEFEAGLQNGGGGFFSGFQDILTGVVQEVGIPLLRQQFLPSQVGGIGGVAQTIGLPAVRTAMAGVPAIQGAVTGVFRVGSIALNTVVSAMRSSGVRATVAKARAFVKRFGPEAAVGFFAGFVGADVANRAVLEAAFLKGRRMNPGNASALRRAVRRVESFHRLCKRADVIAGPKRRRPSARRCAVCKVSPCRC